MVMTMTNSKVVITINNNYYYYYNLPQIHSKPTACALLILHGTHKCITNTYKGRLIDSNTSVLH